MAQTIEKPGRTVAISQQDCPCYYGHCCECRYWQYKCTWYDVKPLPSMETLKAGVK